MKHLPSDALASERRLKSPEKLRLVLEVCALRLVVAQILRRQPDARAALHDLRGRVPGARGPDDGAPAERLIARLAWSTRAVLERLPGDHRCLAQSLVLTALLERHGVGSRVVIGVRKDASGALNAHAWVTVDGKPVSPPGDHDELVEL